MDATLKDTSNPINRNKLCAVGTINMKQSLRFQFMSIVLQFLNNKYLLVSQKN